MADPENIVVALGILMIYVIVSEILLLPVSWLPSWIFDTGRDERFWWLSFTYHIQYLRHSEFSCVIVSTHVNTTSTTNVRQIFLVTHHLTVRTWCCSDHCCRRFYSCRCIFHRGSNNCIYQRIILNAIWNNLRKLQLNCCYPHFSVKIIFISHSRKGTARLTAVSLSEVFTELHKFICIRTRALSRYCSKLFF